VQEGLPGLPAATALHVPVLHVAQAPVHAVAQQI
jgi:hypothetical protein